MIAIKTTMEYMPSDCDYCRWFGTRPHPYKGWTDICELMGHCMDDDQPEEWIYSGDGRPKACPLVEVADRKTENSSEIPNNCEPQTQLVNNSPILAKDLVDDEFNPYDEECMRCMHLKLRCEFVPSYCHYEPKDEPQTEREGKR